MPLEDKDIKYLTYLKNRCRAIEDERETAVNQAHEREEQNKLLKDEIVTQQRLYEGLLTNKAQLHKRLCENSSLESESVTQLIKRRSSILSLDQEKTNKIKKVYKAVITILVPMAKVHLHKITDVSNEELITSPEEYHKEQYKIYGLLLSACRFRKRSSSDGVNQQTSQQVLIAVAKYHAILCDNEALLKSNVEKAVALTHSMLTRLPPLLVCKILLYHEDYYDTNRLTWDETKKTGLLGNTEEEIKDDVLPQKSCELQVKSSLFQDESQSLKEKSKLASSSSSAMDSTISNSYFQKPTGPITNPFNQETRRSVYAEKGVEKPSKNPFSSIMKKKQPFEQQTCREETKFTTTKKVVSKSRVKEKCDIFETEHSSKTGIHKGGTKKTNTRNATPIDSTKQRSPRSAWCHQEKKVTTV